MAGVHVLRPSHWVPNCCACAPAGHLAGIRWASVPAVASTDAPCSALSVICTNDGSFDEYRFFPHDPDLVLVDSQLVRMPLRASSPPASVTR